MSRTRIVVLASGNGSNLQAIVDACAAGALEAEVVAVVSDQPQARALDRAASAGVPGVHVVRRNGEQRDAYDARLADIVSAFSPDLVVLAGWMRILTMAFLGWFPDMVVNLHPALPGELPGVDAIQRALDEARAGRRAVTGVTVHLVPDAGASTVSVMLASRDGRPVPDLDAVRDAWVSTLNQLGRPD